MSSPLTRDRLEVLFDEWNRPEFISPDPLETLAAYPETADREVAGLFAAALAYGRVSALLVPLKRILTAMGASPRDYVLHRSEAEMRADFAGIVHRFARPVHLAALAAGAGRTIRRSGSLEAAFLAGYRGCGSDDAAGGDVMNGLKTLVSALRESASGDAGHLLPDPVRGSACKRLHLYLRWMVRRDGVDPGGWDSVSPADLMLPLDTWTHRIALRAGWTARKAADGRTVREVTAALAALNPEDPVKYDFALSRFGIRSGLNIDALFD